MYTSQKRYQDAERAALAAYQGYTKHLGENHASTRAALEQLASLYAESGQPDKASVWRLKLK
jgi:tetratricopeptide repeat protein